MLNPKARHEVLTRLTWAAADRPEDGKHLARLFERAFEPLFSTAVAVAVETGDPIGKVMAGHVERRVEGADAYRLLEELEQDGIEGALPLRELQRALTQSVLQWRLDTWPEPRSEEQREELAALHHKLGLRNREVGLPDEAVEPLREAIRLRRELMAAGIRRLQPSLAVSLDGLGTTLSDLHRREEALRASEESIQLLRDLVADDTPRLRAALAKSLYNSSAVATELGRHEQAHSAAAEAVQIYRELMEQGVDDVRGDLGKSLVNWSVDQAALGMLDQALETQQEAVALLEELSALHPERYTIDLTLALYGLGNRLGDLGRHDEALEATHRAVAIRRDLARHRPDLFLPSLSRGLATFGHRLARAERTEEAIDVTREAIEMLREPAERQPEIFEPQLAEALNNLGNRLSQVGEYEEARDVTAEAVRIRRRLLQRSATLYGPLLAQSLSNLGNRLATAGRYEQALDATTEAVELLQPASEINPSHRPWLAIATVNRGRHLRDLGRYRESVTVLEEAVSSWEALASTTRTGFRENLGNAYANVATSLRYAGEHERAIEAQHRAVETYRSLAASYPAYREDLAEKLTDLGNLFLETGRPERAEPLLREAVERARTVLSADEDARAAVLANALQVRGMTLSRLGDHRGALECSSESVALLRPLAERRPADFETSFIRASNHQALDLTRLGQVERGIEILHELLPRQKALLEARNPYFTLFHGMSLRNLGEMLRLAGRINTSLERTHESVSLHRKLAREHRPPAFRKQLAFSLQTHSASLSAADRDDKAMEAAQRTLEILSELDAPDDRSLPDDLAIARRNLGACLVNVGRAAEGVDALHQALESHRELALEHPQRYRPELMRTLQELGVALSRLGEHDESLRKLKEALAIARSLYELNSTVAPDLAKALRSFAVELYHLGDPEGALAPSREALEIDVELTILHGLRPRPELVQSLSNRVGILAALGRSKEAVETFERTLGRLMATTSGDGGDAWLADLRGAYVDLCQRLGESPDDTLGRRGGSSTPGAHQ